MNKTIWVMMFSLMTTGSMAQNFSIDLWPAGQVPNHRPSIEKEKWDTTEIVRVLNVQTPSVSVFLPVKRHATGEAVVICPGGGYRILAHDLEGTDIAKYFNSKGIAAVVLKYRLPVPENNIIPHKSPLMDAQRAIRLVRFHASKWNIDPQKIGIMGFSAGGHLASSTSTHYDRGVPGAADPVDQLSCRPDFSILMYPVITFTDPAMHTGSMKSLLGEDNP